MTAMMNTAEARIISERFCESARLSPANGVAVVIGDFVSTRFRFLLRFATSFSECKF
jgi:hypothetical protein